MNNDPRLLFGNLLADLAAHIGLDDAAGLTTGRALRIDGVEFGLLLDDDDPQARDIHLIAELGKPASLTSSLQREMLEANLLGLGTGGAAIGLHPETGAAFLCRALPLAGTSGADLAAVLNAMVDAVKSWSAILADPARAGGRAEPAFAGNPMLDVIRG